MGRFHGAYTSSFGVYGTFYSALRRADVGRRGAYIQRLLGVCSAVGDPFGGHHGCILRGTLLKGLRASAVVYDAYGFGCRLHALFAHDGCQGSGV